MKFYFILSYKIKRLEMKIKQINWSHLIINLICLVSTFSILYWIFLYCSHGIDFTDEGFYLNWISNPFLYKASTTQFGYIYHPLFLLVEGNISKLRQFKDKSEEELRQWILKKSSQN